MADVEINVEGEGDLPASEPVVDVAADIIPIVEAHAAADVAVIEAEAAADVARIEAAGEVAAVIAERNFEQELSECQTTLEALSTENISLRAELETARALTPPPSPPPSPPEPNLSPEESVSAEATPASPSQAEMQPEPKRTKPRVRWI